MSIGQPNLFARQVKATSSWHLLEISYRKVFKNYEPIIILFFIPTLIQILGSFYVGRALSFNSHHHYVYFSHLSGQNIVGLVLLTLWLIASIINFAPAIYFRLQASSNQQGPSTIECYKEGFKVFWKVLLSEILFLIIVIIGFIALILPGILLFRRYVLLPYYAAQNPKLSLKELFKLSSKQSAPFIYYIYGTYLVIMVVNLVAAEVFGGLIIGEVIMALITYSVLFMPALRYLEITKHFRTHQAKAN